jgi:pimeloyl-ACP methyl ester carboxylesterase
MRLSAMRPTMIHAVVLNDIGAVVEARGMARIRSYVGKLPAPRSASDAVDLLERLMSEQFTGLSESDWALYAKITFADAEGKFGARYDPKLMKPLESLDLEQPLSTFWPQFDGLRNVPLLLIRGANSDILSTETLAEMARRHPGCQIHIVEGQGHPPLLLDAPTIDRICRFVADADAHQCAA